MKKNQSRNGHDHEPIQELNRPLHRPEEEKENGRHDGRGQGNEEKGHSGVCGARGGYCNGKPIRIESSPGAK